jgi:hypothetical protein
LRRCGFAAESAFEAAEEFDGIIAPDEPCVLKNSECPFSQSDTVMKKSEAPRERPRRGWWTVGPPTSTSLGTDKDGWLLTTARRGRHQQSHPFANEKWHPFELLELSRSGDEERDNVIIKFVAND